MGANYTNITVRGASRVAIVQALGECEALVTPVERDCVVVFDSAGSFEEDNKTRTLAERLAAELKCPALAVCVHDDDVMQYALFVGGKLADEYNSAPSYFTDDQQLAPAAGGNAAALVAAFGVGDPQAIEAFLRAPKLGEGGYLFETQRHAALAEALGIPDWVVGFGFEEMEGGWYPEGLTSRKLKRTGPKRNRKKAAADPDEKQFTEQLIRDLMEQGRLETALGEAARWGRLDLVKELLAKGLGVNDLSENGAGPLTHAASGGQTEIVEYLIARGADVNAISGQGTTALMACVGGFHATKTYLAIARALLKAGAARTLGTVMAGKTVLEWARDGRPPELVELIERYSREHC